MWGTLASSQAGPRRWQPGRRPQGRQELARREAGGGRQAGGARRAVERADGCGVAPLGNLPGLDAKLAQRVPDNNLGCGQQRQQWWCVFVWVWVGVLGWVGGGQAGRGGRGMRPCPKQQQTGPGARQALPPPLPRTCQHADGAGERGRLCQDAGGRGRDVVAVVVGGWVGVGVGVGVGAAGWGGSGGVGRLV